MKRALVIGASGGMGYSIVKELSSRGIEVIAFARKLEKLDKMFHDDRNVIIHPGDVFDKKELEAAAYNVDVIFHAINLPYEEWADKLLKLTENVITVAIIQKTKLAIVDNIYSYGRNPGYKVSETIPKNPHTKKGKLRLEMGKLINESGVPNVIVHFPDFYGPYVENGYINYTLRKIVANKKASFVGDQFMNREHIYTPDGAKAIVELALNDDAYGQSWNVPAVDVIKGEEIIQMVRSITGYDKRVSTITKNMIRSLGLFNKQMREFAEMQYLNEDPVVLDGEKYETFIGTVPKTPYIDGLKETIASYQR
ncbi:SDR family NAD(P)-dependent oxidoreductase [Virgibacillus ndiopensis]|uniref:SDR family NAD(P)-dependent oxidoreductase n=1 Tax=Virgibacillus ndiopensis TaxID=2004408 RepID=UPI000C069DB3|nr:SDR family NAD(P)-dependent oxidoreductase [Virgibacillus ndiopensis]